MRDERGLYVSICFSLCFCNTDNIGEGLLVNVCVLKNMVMLIVLLIVPWQLNADVFSACVTEVLFVGRPFLGWRAAHFSAYLKVTCTSTSLHNSAT